MSTSERRVCSMEALTAGISWGDDGHWLACDGGWWMTSDHRAAWSTTYTVHRDSQGTTWYSWPLSDADRTYLDCDDYVSTP